jgi:acetyl/propionyl-CoA carboxylase alpha subunit
LRKAFARAAREAQGALRRTAALRRALRRAARATSRCRCSATCTLGERECSLQRRRQKVVEEAPRARRTTRPSCARLRPRSPRSIGYVGAGTLEFLVDDATGDYFFIEMNTRIQVEHPSPSWSPAWI